MALRNGLDEHSDDPELVAHHEWLADSTAAGHEILLQAARQAERFLDDEGAARWYHRARSRVGRGRPELGAQLALALGEARQRAGDPVGATQALQEAMALSGGDRLLGAKARRGLAATALAVGDRARATGELELALSLAAADANLVGELCLELAALHTAEARADQATRALRRGLTATGAEPGSSIALSARLHLSLAELAAHAGRTDEARSSAEEALALGEVPDAERARAHAFLARLARARPDLFDADHLALALGAYRTVGDRRAQAELLLSAASDLAVDPDTAARWLSEAATLAAQVQWLAGRDLARAELARISLDAATPPL